MWRPCAPPAVRQSAPAQVSIARRLLAECFRYIPCGLVSQFMSSLNSPGGLTTADGRLRYCNPQVRAPRPPAGPWVRPAPPPLAP